ncbi:MAG: 4-alpha-glucanotransferase [Myxococcales bacterium]|nr:4-alpha-glucanotransferase [Myxococcales bacterium]
MGRGSTGRFLPSARGGAGASWGVSEDDLGALCRLRGLETSYVDGLGEMRTAPVEVVLAVLRSLGVPIERVRDAPDALRGYRAQTADLVSDPVVVAWDGAPARIRVRWKGARMPDVHWSLGGPSIAPSGSSTSALVRAELVSVPGEVGEGSVRTYEFEAPPLPTGRHPLHLLVEGELVEIWVLSAPRRVRPFRNRTWGAFVPLYALHHGDRRIGDLGDLGRVADWSKTLGASAVGTLPLLASYLDEPFEPSPYAPVSRLFWNELFLHIEALPEWSAARRSDTPSEQNPSSVVDLVDYRGEMARKRGLLEPLVAIAFRNGVPEYVEGYVAERPEVIDYARFRASIERGGPEAEPRWPGPSSGSAAAWEDPIVRYHVYVQHHLAKQVASVARRGEGLYLDMPVGVHPKGYDARRYRSAFLDGCAAGAPPDALFTGGQNWGFPPLHPDGLREEGLAYLDACLAFQAEHASILRIDHVMGLERIFCVPNGAATSEGLYLHFRSEELWALLCIASHAQECTIVGENLGTVSKGVRDRMAEHAVPGMYVAEFSFGPEGDDAPLHTPGPADVASIGTHDTPTFMGFWSGRDIQERVEMGLLTGEAAVREHAARATLRDRLARWVRESTDPTPSGAGVAAEVLDKMLVWLARSDAPFLLVNLEDLWLEEAPQNVPGTDSSWNNWRRRTVRRLEDVLADDGLAERLRRLSLARRR